jgi:hypothetical protein
MMANIEQDKTDLGTISVLLKRTKRRIPNMLVIKQRMLDGETLSDVEIMELQSILGHANDNRALVERHPELKELSTKMIALYEEITQLALANEKKGGESPKIDLSD